MIYFSSMSYEQLIAIHNDKIKQLEQAQQQVSDTATQKHRFKQTHNIHQLNAQDENVYQRLIRQYHQEMERKESLTNEIENIEETIQRRLQQPTTSTITQASSHTHNVNRHQLLSDKEILRNKLQNKLTQLQKKNQYLLKKLTNHSARQDILILQQSTTKNIDSLLGLLKKLNSITKGKDTLAQVTKELQDNQKQLQQKQQKLQELEDTYKIYSEIIQEYQHSYVDPEYTNRLSDVTSEISQIQLEIVELQQQDINLTTQYTEISNLLEYEAQHLIMISYSLDLIEKRETLLQNIDENERQKLLQECTDIKQKIRDIIQAVLTIRQQNEETQLKEIKITPANVLSYSPSKNTHVSLLQDTQPQALLDIENRERTQQITQLQNTKKNIETQTNTSIASTSKKEAYANTLFISYDSYFPFESQENYKRIPFNPNVWSIENIYKRHADDARLLFELYQDNPIYVQTTLEKISQLHHQIVGNNPLDYLIINACSQQINRIFSHVHVASPLSYADFNQNQHYIDVNDEITAFCKRVQKLAPNELLFLPILEGTASTNHIGHYTLLCFKKANDGSIQPLFFNSLNNRNSEMVNDIKEYILKYLIEHNETLCYFADTINLHHHTQYHNDCGPECINFILFLIKYQFEKETDITKIKTSAIELRKKFHGENRVFATEDYIERRSELLRENTLALARDSAYYDTP